VQPNVSPRSSTFWIDDQGSGGPRQTSTNAKPFCEDEYGHGRGSPSSRTSEPILSPLVTVLASSVAGSIALAGGLLSTLLSLTAAWWHIRKGGATGLRAELRRAELEVDQARKAATYLRALEESRMYEALAEEAVMMTRLRLPAGDGRRLHCLAGGSGE